MCFSVYWVEPARVIPQIGSSLRMEKRICRREKSAYIARHVGSLPHFSLFDASGKVGRKASRVRLGALCIGKSRLLTAQSSGAVVGASEGAGHSRLRIRAAASQQLASRDPTRTRTAKQRIHVPLRGGGRQDGRGDRAISRNRSASGNGGARCRPWASGTGGRRTPRRRKRRPLRRAGLNLRRSPERHARSRR